MADRRKPSEPVHARQESSQREPAPDAKLASDDRASHSESSDVEAQVRAKRRPLILFTWYHVVGGSESGIARSCDISTSGVGLFTARPLPKDERVFLEIATNKGNLSCTGTVVHCSEESEHYYRVGVQIEIVPPNDRPLLASILES